MQSLLTVNSTAEKYINTKPYFKINNIHKKLRKLRLKKTK